MDKIYKPLQSLKKILIIVFYITYNEMLTGLRAFVASFATVKLGLKKIAYFFWISSSALNSGGAKVRAVTINENLLKFQKVTLLIMCHLL